VPLPVEAVTVMMLAPCGVCGGVEGAPPPPHRTAPTMMTLVFDGRAVTVPLVYMVRQISPNA
jgi:hypothetical protein